MIYRITRYKNRKLYSKETSCYLTLDDVRQIVQDGHDVQILSPQGEDWTSRVLASIYADLLQSESAERLHDLIWEAA